MYFTSSSSCSSCSSCFQPKLRYGAYRVDFLFVFLDVSQTVCPSLLASVCQLNCCLWLLHTVVCVCVCCCPPLYFSITTNCKIKLNHGSAAPNPKHGLNIHKQKVQKKTPMHKIKGAKNHSQVCWPWRGANKHYWCVYTI